MVAAARAAGTPSLAIVAKVPSRFDARTRPSWMKIQASRSRASSSRPSCHGGGMAGNDLVMAESSVGWEGGAGPVSIPTPRASAARLGGDRLLEVRTFLAAAGTELPERGELVPGLGHVAHLDIQFAEILACRLIVRLQLEGFRVVGQRRLEIAGLAQGEAEQVVDIRPAGCPRRGRAARSARPCNPWRRSWSAPR